MAPQITSTLREVRELICNRQFHEALVQLKSVDHSELSEQELGEFYILRARAAVFSGSEDNLPGDIDRAIEIFRNGSTALFAEVKYLRGVWQSIQGYYSEAKQDLLEAHMSFVRCGDRAGSAMALGRLSYAHVMIGDIDAAIRNLKKCLGIYSELRSLRNETSVSQNLYCLCYRAGRLHESSTGYSEIESQILDIGNRSSVIFYEMSAIPHALRGDVRTARAIISKAKPYLNDYPRERAIYYENLGLINLLDGQYKTSEKALKRGLEIAFEIGSESSLVSQIKRLFGDLYLATEQWDKAEQFTSEALRVAEKIGERVEIAACHRIFAQLEQHRGHDDKARDWFTKAIDIFSLIGSNYELAITRYVAAASGTYPAIDSVGMLWAAKKYFRSEDVKPYLKKVENLFGELQPPRPAIIRRGGQQRSAPTIIGGSSVMKDLIADAKQVAPLNTTVLLSGATGTGKDLFAKLIHHESGRPGPFIAVNIASLSSTLIESELFGHKKGAFTGASEARKGFFQAANNGTFFLDEVGETPLDVQAKLLRAIETREIIRVGNTKPTIVDVRLVAATNRDLRQRIDKGLFREDLYQRLKQCEITLPPLSERKEDIPRLVEHFLKTSGNGFKVNGNGQAIKRLGILLSFPDYEGNIRELMYRVDRLLFMSKGDVDLMIRSVREDDSLSEDRELLTVLELTGWNRSHAAGLLGVSEGTVRNRIKRYGLSKINS